MAKELVIPEFIEEMNRVLNEKESHKIYWRDPTVSADSLLIDLQYQISMMDTFFVNDKPEASARIAIHIANYAMMIHDKLTHHAGYGIIE